MGLILRSIKSELMLNGYLLSLKFGFFGFYISVLSICSFIGVKNVDDSFNTEFIGKSFFCIFENIYENREYLASWS